MPPKKKTDENIVKIHYKGEDIEINLDKNCPEELMEIHWKNSNIQYIPVKLTRAILRALELQGANVGTDRVVTSGGLVVSYNVAINIGWTIYCGESADYLKSNSVSNSLMGQESRIWSNAIKSALRFKFKFFEAEKDAEDLQREQEKNAPKSKSKKEPELKPLEKPASDDKINTEYVGIMNEKLAKVDSKVKLQVFMEELKADIKNGKATKTDGKAIKEMNNDIISKYLG